MVKKFTEQVRECGYQSLNIDIIMYTKQGRIQ
jgi:hypothetical protein